MVQVAQQFDMKLTFALTILAVATATCIVEVNVVYPSANLQSGDVLTLRGNSPLSWTQGISLTRTGTNSWSTTVTLADSPILNWVVLMKVLVNDNMVCSQKIY